jgi:hypothetical protein
MRGDKDIIIKFIEKGWTYNPETGDIYSHTGRLISAKSNKHIQAAILQTKVLAHRLAWYLTYGELPEIIDHINRNRNDNRLCNLRNVTTQQNAFNTNAKGIRKIKNKDTWTAQITINNKQIYLGSFKSEEEAQTAYLNAKKIYHKI